MFLNQIRGIQDVVLENAKKAMKCGPKVSIGKRRLTEVWLLRSFSTISNFIRLPSSSPPRISRNECLRVHWQRHQVLFISRILWIYSCQKFHFIRVGTNHLVPHTIDIFSRTICFKILHNFNSLSHLPIRRPETFILLFGWCKLFEEMKPHFHFNMHLTWE